jgi:hypothetical protein
MRIKEIIEAINADQIGSVAGLRNIQDARTAALAVLHSQTASPKKRADMRDEIMAAGTTDQLMKILWKWKLSLDGGMTLGTPTVRTGKGIGYAR